MDEIDGGNFEGVRPLNGSRGSEGRFSLEGTSPTPALKAKADMIAAAQDLTVVEEQQEEFLGVTKSFISDDDKDESEIVVPMREPIKGQAASQTGVKVDGKLHGQGTEQYLDGTFYEGNFVNGEKHGEGKYTYADGAYYKGTWENDKMQGQGSFVWGDGRGYQGDWLNSQIHGHGKMKFSDGSIYEGQFVNGNRKGLGKFTKPDGSSYEGKWR